MARSLAGLSIKGIAAPNAHLHLSTIPEAMPEAIRLLQAWGFRYETSLVWTTPPIGYGAYWRRAHKVLLLGVRGRLPFHDNSIISWLEEQSGRSTETPRSLRHLIEQVSLRRTWTCSAPTILRVGLSDSDRSSELRIRRETDKESNCHEGSLNRAIILFRRIFRVAAVFFGTRGGERSCGFRRQHYNPRGLVAAMLVEHDAASSLSNPIATLAQGQSPQTLPGSHSCCTISASCSGVGGPHIAVCSNAHCARAWNRSSSGSILAIDASFVAIDGAAYDLNPATDAVAVAQYLPTFQVRLTDSTYGIIDTSVDSLDVAVNRDGSSLTLNTDYTFSYDAASDHHHLAFTAWQL